MIRGHKPAQADRAAEGLFADHGIRRLKVQQDFALIILAVAKIGSFLLVFFIFCPSCSECSYSLYI